MDPEAHGDDNMTLEPAIPPEHAHDASDPGHTPDAFARMIAVLRTVTGYDPGAEDEEEDELAAGRTQRWAGRTILFAVLTLAVLNAPSIRSWATTLSPSWASETIVQLADVWNTRTATAGLQAPRDAVTKTYGGWKAAKWEKASKAGKTR